MHKAIRIILGLSLIVSLCQPARAELKNEMFDVKHLDYSTGLSSEKVFSIVEDRDNVIWIATKSGVDRYNGVQIKSYSLPGNVYYGDLAGRMIYLHYDEHRGLLAYDNAGRIYAYSYENDSFVLKYSLGQMLNEEIILNKIYFTEDSTMWIGLDKGLFKMPEDGELVPVINNLYVNDILKADNSLYIGSSIGVWKLKAQDSYKAKPILDNLNVRSLYHDTARNELWVGSFSEGLVVIGLGGATYTFSSINDKELLRPVRAITEYDGNQLLIGIDGGGVYAIDKRDRKANLLFNTEGRANGNLRGNGVYAVLKDSQSNIWIGSYTGGVTSAILSEYPLTFFMYERGNYNSISNNNVNGVAEGPDGDLWFANDNGISIFNRRTRSWKHRLNDVVAISLCRRSGGGFWVSTYGDGIYMLDESGNTLKHLTVRNGGLTTNHVLSIREDRKGDVWAGGLEGNLMRLNQNGNVSKTYNINWVQALDIVDDEHIAVATVNGFCIINTISHEITYYATSQEFQNKANASAYIVSMLFNEDNTVWLGTEGGGLNLYNIENRSIEVFTTEHGLPSNDIYSLGKDVNGRIWMSTGHGLATMDDRNIENVNYLGDVKREYNKNAFTYLSGGEFIYGSTDGAVMLNPESISRTDIEAPLRFTGLDPDYANEQEEKELKPSLRSALAAGMIELDYSRNSFTIEFESINHKGQNDIVYQYILEGYDKGWSEISEIGFAHYAHVMSGKYRFMARSMMKSNGLVISEDSFRLRISPPWWRTWWAFILYPSVLLAVLSVLFLLIRNNKLRKELEKLYESAETKAVVNKFLPADTSTENDRAFIAKATVNVLANIDNSEFNINQLCKEMAMSRTMFFQRLKSLTGHGPQEFIRLIRLEKAAELLKQGVSVGDAAVETGFGNIKYFSTLFKKHFGVSPSKYMSEN